MAKCTVCFCDVLLEFMRKYTFIFHMNHLPADNSHEMSFLIWFLRQQQTVITVVDFLFIVTPIVGVCNCSMFCCTLLYVHSSMKSS